MCVKRVATPHERISFVLFTGQLFSGMFYLFFFVQIFFSLDVVRSHRMEQKMPTVQMKFRDYLETVSC